MNTNETPSKSGPTELTEPTSEADLPESEISSTSAKTQQPRSDAEAAEMVAALLRGEEPQEAPAEAGEPEPSPEGEEAAPEAPEPPTTATDAAERLGMKPEELYSLEITTGDGEAVTLGELKDAYQSREVAERESAERAAALDERETAIFADQQLFAELGESLTQFVPKQQLQKLSERLQKREETERRMMVNAMPELSDPQVYDQFRADAVEMLKAYGYQPHEVVIGDHRQLVVIRDLMRAKKRLKDLKDYKPTANPPAARKGKGKTPTPSKTQRLVERARQSRHESDKVAAVSALLNGG